MSILYIVVLSDPISEEELEPWPSNKDGTSPPGISGEARAVDNVVPGIEGVGWLDGELPALTNTVEDWLQTGSDNERQQIPSDEELPPSPIRGHGEWSRGKVKGALWGCWRGGCPTLPHKKHLAWADLIRGWERMSLSGTSVCIGTHFPGLCKFWLWTMFLPCGSWILFVDSGPCLMELEPSLWTMDFLLAL